MGEESSQAEASTDRAASSQSVELTIAGSMEGAAPEAGGEEEESVSLLHRRGEGTPEGHSSTESGRAWASAGSSLSSLWSQAGAVSLKAFTKQEQLWQVLQSFTDSFGGAGRRATAKGRRARKKKHAPKEHILESDSEDDEEMQDEEGEARGGSELFRKLRRMVEKVLLAVGCFCCVMVLALALVGLVSVLLWFSSGSISHGGSSRGGMSPRGVEVASEAQDVTQESSTARPAIPGRGGGSDTSGERLPVSSYAQWMDWWHLHGRTCENVQIPIPAVGKMREDEKVGQMVAVSIEDVERQRGIAAAVSSDLVGAVYARPGDQPVAGKEAHHWSSLIQRIQTAAQGSRLRIPTLVGLEMMHGPANVPGATVFPHAVAVGATHNVSLAQMASFAEAKEAASMGIRWVLGPTLSVCRDPRWGRCLECVGENERLVRILNSRLDGLTGAAKGPGWSLLEQNQGLLLPTARFFMGEAGSMTGHSGPDSNLEMPDDAEFRAMHLRPFFDANIRGVQMVMLGEGQVNGQPIHNNTYLINILKKQFRYAGVLVSSFNGLDSIRAKSLQEQVETVVNAGVDMILAPKGQHLAVLRALRKGLRRGSIRLERVNDAVRRILRAKELSAHFDYPCAPYLSSPGKEDAGGESAFPALGNEEHRELARKVVQQSLVLLKNGGQGKDVVFPLPLTDQPARNGQSGQGLTVYVGGSHADDMGRQCGGYTISSPGAPGPITQGTTVLEGFQSLLPPPSQVIKLAEGERVQLGRGKKPFPPNTFAVLAVGEDPYSGPEGDVPAAALRLSKESEELVEDTCSKVACIVVLLTGRPVDLTEIIQHANAIVAAWLPGSEAAGIADVFLKETLDFQGTLPLTWFHNATAQLPMNFGDAGYSPLFSYGYGLTKNGLILNGTFVSRA